jgi:ribosomal protein L40E
MKKKLCISCNVRLSNKSGFIECRKCRAENTKTMLKVSADNKFASEVKRGKFLPS